MLYKLYPLLYPLLYKVSTNMILFEIINARYSGCMVFRFKKAVLKKDGT
jgi:hypothetical protein